MTSKHPAFSPFWGGEESPWSRPNWSICILLTTLLIHQSQSQSLVPATSRDICSRVTKLELPLKAFYTDLKAALTTEKENLQTTVETYAKQPVPGQYWIASTEKNFREAVNFCAQNIGVLLHITEDNRPAVRIAYPDSKIYVIARVLQRAKGAANTEVESFFTQEGPQILRYVGETKVARPVQLGTNCMVYNTADDKYEADSCTSKHTAVCQPEGQLRDRVRTTEALATALVTLEILISQGLPEKALTALKTQSSEENACTAGEDTIPLQDLLGLRPPWGVKDKTRYALWGTILTQHMETLMDIIGDESWSTPDDTTEGDADVCLCHISTNRTRNEGMPPGRFPTPVLEYVMLTHTVLILVLTVAVTLMCIHQCWCKGNGCATPREAGYHEAETRERDPSAENSPPLELRERRDTWHATSTLRTQDPVPPRPITPPITSGCPR